MDRLERLAEQYSSVNFFVVSKNALEVTDGERTVVYYQSDDIPCTDTVLLVDRQGVIVGQAHPATRHLANDIELLLRGQ